MQCEPAGFVPVVVTEVCVRCESCEHPVLTSSGRENQFHRSVTTRFLFSCTLELQP